MITKEQQELIAKLEAERDTYIADKPHLQDMQETIDIIFETLDPQDRLLYLNGMMAKKVHDLQTALKQLAGLLVKEG